MNVNTVVCGKPWMFLQKGLLIFHSFTERFVFFYKFINLTVCYLYFQWPFIKFLGLQEPASVIFSICNLLTHIYLLKKFRAEVRPDSPCYKLWHILTIASINGWIWSTIFHARDFPITEFLDYTSAYLIVITALYCFSIRICYKMNIFLKLFITILFSAFYIQYFSYLAVGSFSYSFNMKTNIITGNIRKTNFFLKYLN